MFGPGAHAGDPTDAQAKAAWEDLKRRPVDEANFRAVCDLLQDIARTDIELSYRLLAEYEPMVRATHNRGWLHILLMGWAKAKESLGSTADAEGLYAAARANAARGVDGDGVASLSAGDARRYDEALVGTVLLYAEWGKPDSLQKYVALGKTAATAAGDTENLSFLYTFGALGNMADTAAMGQGLRKAMSLAAELPNKNAYFTAKYNFASIYCRNDPQTQVGVLQSLLELANDSTLTHRYRLYERTAFAFRNARPSIYLQLMQVNLLLTDYENAGKFGELLYDAVVRPNPAAPQAPFFTSELAIVKAYEGKFEAAHHWLSQSAGLFKVPVAQIPYPSYFLAAGMLAEHAHKYDSALSYYGMAYRMGGMEGLHLMPSALYYAHALVGSNRLMEAGRILDSLRLGLPGRVYTAYGYYFYKHEAELLKAKGDDNGYARALEQYYAIKDSLTNLHHYRAIEEIEARVRVRDKEEQIDRLNREQLERKEKQRRERLFFLVLFGLGVGLVLLLIGYIRQRELVQKRRIGELEKQHRIEVMQGAIDAERRERHSIADQLHDEVGGLLSLAILNLSSAMEKEPPRDDPAGRQLNRAQESLQTIAVTVREISHRLTPLGIEKYGFRHAVQDLVDAVNGSYKLSLELVMIGFDSGDPVFPEAFLTDLYRMVQELVQNILKHARATKGVVQLVQHEEGVSLLVEDDGIGFGETTAAGGRGLQAIHARVAYYNGRIELSEKKENGVLIMIELPMEKINK